MKKLFVVVVNDWGNGILDGPQVLHIRAENAAIAQEHVEDMFNDDDLDFFTEELTDNDIIEI